MNQKTTRRLAGAMSVAASAALSACGGGGSGVVSDPGGTSTSTPMSCSVTCTASDTLDTGSLQAHYLVIDDGSRAQAQAGFFTHDLVIGYDVELEGDTLDFVEGGQTIAMALPKNTTIGTPYVADIPSLPATALDGQFQLVRAGGTLTSDVTLPAPFRLLAPASGTTVASTTTDLAVTLDVAPDADAVVADVSTMNCKDANSSATYVQTTLGNTSAYFSATDDTHYLFHPNQMPEPSFIDLNGNTVTLASCIATLRVQAQNTGTLSAGFKTGSAITAEQVRTVTVTLTY